MNLVFKKINLCLLAVLLIASTFLPQQGITIAAEKNKEFNRQMENLDRGLVAVQVEDGVFISWRLLGTDPESVSFNLYRDGKKVNSEPITSSTNYLGTNGTPDSNYYVQAVLNGNKVEKSETVSVWGKKYLSVPLQKPEGGTTPDGVSYTYTANDASVGDLDGDGEYEIVLKWDPTNSKDNSQTGYTGNVLIDAYELDGTHMWRINLGKNVRAGAHYTQFLVYDLDGNGKSEIAVKTADGTVDGKGKVIGDSNADYRNEDGRIIAGPEYLTVFNGETGKELQTTQFSPARGDICDWGDCYGNRGDRFLAGIAYLDGKRPSLIMGRGYYEKTMLTAYNYRNGELTKLWTFDSDDPGNEKYASQGNHNLSIADVDNDDKDEIIYGAMAVDDDGTGLYTTGLGHGDAMHLGDLNPDRSGLEFFGIHEREGSASGDAMEIRDPGTGEILWSGFKDQDIGRGVAADIDPRYKGAEVWASQARYGRPNAFTSGVLTITGNKITDAVPSSTNFGIWWDGDLLRELLDHDYHENLGTGAGTISKWDYKNNQTVRLLTAEGTYSNNGTKGNPSLQADIIGDWREEVIWKTEDSQALRVYTTTTVSDDRIYTLMHDPVYRLGIAWQNVAYNQPPHTSFYLGAGMDKPSKPDIYTIVRANVDVKPETLNLKSKGGKNSVTTKIELPGNAKVSSVKMRVNGEMIMANSLRNGSTAKFNRQAVIEALQGENGDITVTVTGSLEDGNTFIGEDTIRVIH